MGSLRFGLYNTAVWAVWTQVSDHEPDLSQSLLGSRWHALRQSPAGEYHETDPDVAQDADIPATQSASGMPASPARLSEVLVQEWNGREDDRERLYERGGVLLNLSIFLSSQEQRFGRYT